MSHGYADKQIVVVGAGKSGQALARFFCAQGARVILSDRRSRDELGEIVEHWQNQVQLDIGGHDPRLLTGADLVVISPGVPSNLPVLGEARNAGVPVLGEVEIAWRELPVPLVGITGTNGKSTTTALCGEMFSQGGYETFVGGNLGTPLINAVEIRGWQWLVVELSSFQLETIRDFRPKYAMLLNLSPDHLDRYAGMEDYYQAKLRLFENQSCEDVAILNADDAEVVARAANLTAAKIWFSSASELGAGMFVAGHELVWRHAGEETRFDSRQLQLRGAHNLENVMAAMIPPLLEGVATEIVWQAACGFKGLPHRMQLVRQLNGTDWINDSKGTNVGSVIKSLQGLNAPVTLIAGGKDKGGSFAELEPLVRAKVGTLLLIGEAAERISRELNGAAIIQTCDSLGAAVLQAQEVTPAGGTVILSPGCSSFDMFMNFEARGDEFARQVLNLPEVKAV